MRGISYLMDGSDMKIIVEINREVRMFLSENDLPAHGRAVAWGFAAVVAAAAFAIVCFGISLLK